VSSTEDGLRRAANALNIVAIKHTNDLEVSVNKTNAMVMKGMMNVSTKNKK
jgi:hypothetical protein